MQCIRAFRYSANIHFYHLTLETFELYSGCFEISFSTVLKMVNYILVSLNKSLFQSEQSGLNFKTNHAFHLYNPNLYIVHNKGITFFQIC